MVQLLLYLLRHAVELKDIMFAGSQVIYTRNVEGH